MVYLFIAVQTIFFEPSSAFRKWDLLIECQNKEIWVYMVNVKLLDFLK